MVADLNDVPNQTNYDAWTWHFRRPGQFFERKGLALDFLIRKSVSDIIGIIDENFFWVQPDILTYVENLFAKGYKCVGCSATGNHEPPFIHGMFVDRKLALSQSFHVSIQEVKNKKIVGWRLRKVLADNPYITISGVQHQTPKHISYTTNIEKVSGFQVVEPSNYPLIPQILKDYLREWGVESDMEWEGDAWKNIDIDKYKNFWETCSPVFSHLSFDGHHHDSLEKNLYNKELREAFGKFDFNDKKIVDFGCGGGLTSRFLFDNYKPRAYVGIDISDRSLAVAKERMSDHLDKCSFVPHDLNFKQHNADVFLCLACIQHFPSKNYIDNFFLNLNDSGIKDLILQYRFDVRASFKKVTTYSEKEIVKTNLINCHYYKDMLFKYILLRTYRPPRLIKRSKYEFAFLTLR